MRIFSPQLNPAYSAADCPPEQLGRHIKHVTRLMSSAVKLGTGGHINGPTSHLYMTDPWAIWSGATRSNYGWMLDYLRHLLDLYFVHSDEPHADYKHFKKLGQMVMYITAGSLYMFPENTNS